MQVDTRTERGTAFVTLSNPPVNALSLDLLGHLDRALDELDDGRCLVVSSGVAGQFSAGADLAVLRSGDEALFGDYLDRLNALVERVAEWPAPTIAVIDGTALGGGLELALACDLRVVSEAATVGLPECTLGLLPGAGGLHRLNALCARPVVLDMLLTGRSLSGEQAVAAGLAQYCATSPAAFATELAARMGAGPLPALRGIKQAVAALDAPGADGPAIERTALLDLFTTPDAREGVTAFFDRRRPVFS